jgi:hypothetical protein
LWRSALGAWGRIVVKIFWAPVQAARTKADSGVPLHELREIQRLEATLTLASTARTRIAALHMQQGQNWRAVGQVLEQTRVTPESFDFP